MIYMIILEFTIYVGRGPDLLPQLLVAGLLCVILGAYVFRKNPYLKGSRPFIVLMSFAALNSIAEFLMINAPDEGRRLSSRA